MNCPKCESVETKVIRTLNVEKTRVNERECESCRHRFTTVAQIVEEMTAYKAAKKIRANGGIYPFRITPNSLGSKQ